MWLPTLSFSLGWPHSECSMALAGLHRRSNRNENLTAFAVLPFNALIDNEISLITLIDHIFINNKMIQKSPDIESGVIYCGLTDHLPIFINLTIDCPLKSHKRPIIRIYGDKNMKKFCEKLEKTNWDKLYEENNVNKALEIFYKNFNHAYQTSFPLKQLQCI